MIYDAECDKIKARTVFNIVLSDQMCEGNANTFSSQMWQKVRFTVTLHAIEHFSGFF